MSRLADDPIYADPVGDRLRAHDQRMREIRWVNAKDMVGYVCIAVTILGTVAAVLYAFVGNPPTFESGFSVTTNTATSITKVPYCRSRDERRCPVYAQDGSTLADGGTK